MKIAYLILAHKDPEFIHRVTNRLVEGSESHCFIHVDKRTSDFDGYMENTESIHFAEERIPAYWGGYSLVAAELKLLKDAVSIGFDRYIIMHGADYPLFSNKYIDEYFESKKEIEFINAIDETTGNQSEWLRYVPKYFLDNPNLLKKLNNKLNVIYWRSSLPKVPAKCTVKYDGKEHHIYRGWGHFGITHACAEYILDFVKMHEEYNHFFRHVYVPDESYFHTIVYNSDFAKKTVNGEPISEEKRSLKALLNLTYFEYPSSVREFTAAEELDYLRSTGYLFFRKASSKSKELLDRIDNDNE